MGVTDGVRTFVDGLSSPTGAIVLALAFGLEAALVGLTTVSSEIALGVGSVDGYTTLLLTVEAVRLVGRTVLVVCGVRLLIRGPLAIDSTIAIGDRVGITTGRLLIVQLLAALLLGVTTALSALAIRAVHGGLAPEWLPEIFGLFGLGVLTVGAAVPVAVAIDGESIGTAIESGWDRLQHAPVTVLGIGGLASGLTVGADLLWGALAVPGVAIGPPAIAVTVWIVAFTAVATATDHGASSNADRQ